MTNERRPWTDDLRPDEIALLGHSVLTDRLIYRVAYNRHMAEHFWKLVEKHELGPLSSGRAAAPTPEEIAEVTEHLNHPQIAEDARLYAECRDRGGCEWGPVENLPGHGASVRCGHCRCSMGAEQLPLVADVVATTP